LGSDISSFGCPVLEMAAERPADRAGPAFEGRTIEKPDRRQIPAFGGRIS